MDNPALDTLAAVPADVYELIVGSSDVKRVVRQANRLHRQQVEKLIVSLHIQGAAVQYWDLFSRFSGLQELTIDVCDEVHPMVNELFRTQRFLEQLATNLQKLTLQKACKGAAMPMGVGFLTGLRSLRLLGYSARGLRTAAYLIKKLNALQTLHITTQDTYRRDASLDLSDMKLPPLLQDLQLQSHCAPGIRIPSGIGGLSDLRTLVLFRCCGDFPAAGPYMMNLQSLSIEHQWCIQPLGRIAAFTSLRNLALSECGILTHLPGEISALSGLQHLAINVFTDLAWLPESISALTGLQSLDLQYCFSLAELPESVSALQGLTLLNLGNCKGLGTLPVGITALTGLRTLILEDCRSLWPEDFGCIWSLSSLRKLDLSLCQIAEVPPGVSALTALECLYLSCCPELQELPSTIGMLSNLTMLSLSGTYEVSLPTELRQLQKGAEFWVASGSETAALAHEILDGSGVKVCEAG